MKVWVVRYKFGVLGTPFGFAFKDKAVALRFVRAARALAEFREMRVSRVKLGVMTRKLDAVLLRGPFHARWGRATRRSRARLRAG